MIQIDLSTLVKRLNPFSRQALEMAASECMSQQASEITVSHVLLQMLAIPRSDVRVITERAEIGAEDLRQALTVENYSTARSADSYPSFSPMLVEWLKEAWLLASAEMQQTELRGGTLLLALLHAPLRYVPPAAARLLTGRIGPMVATSALLAALAGLAGIYASFHLKTSAGASVVVFILIFFVAAAAIGAARDRLPAQSRG